MSSSHAIMMPKLGEPETAKFEKCEVPPKNPNQKESSSLSALLAGRNQEDTKTRCTPTSSPTPSPLPGAQEPQNFPQLPVHVGSLPIRFTPVGKPPASKKRLTPDAEEDRVEHLFKQDKTPQPVIRLY